MPAAAIIGPVVGAGVGGIFSMLASNKQAKAAQQASMLQAQYLQKALAWLKQTYAQTREDLAPWRNVGEEAIYSLADLYGIETPGGKGGNTAGALKAFRDSPEYMFPFQEGGRALEYSRAARGVLQNPGTAKALVEYGQGYAGSRLDSWIGNLYRVAGLGENAAADTGRLGAQYSSNIANTYGNIGSALAKGILGAGEAGAAGYASLSNVIGAGVSQASNNLALLYALKGAGKSAFNNPYAGYKIGANNILAPQYAYNNFNPHGVY